MLFSLSLSSTVAIPEQPLRNSYPLICLEHLFPKDILQNASLQEKTAGSQAILGEAAFSTSI